MSRLLRVARALLGLAAVGLLVWTAVRQGREVREVAGELSVLGVGTSVVSVVLALGCSMLAWRSLLAGLGSTLPVAAASRVFFLGQLGKYLPGSVWPVVAQVELARDLQVPRKRSAATALLAIALGLLTGVVLAGMVLAVPGTSRLSSPLWLLVVPPAVLALVEPRLLLGGFAVLLRVARRQPLPERLDRRAMVVPVAWTFAMWAFFGAHVWALTADVGGSGARLPLTALGAFAVAWVSGFAVLFAPAGAGVREQVMVAALAPALAAGPATVVALASRFVMTLADVVVAAVAAPLGRRR